MADKPATTYVVSVFDKQHWQTVLTTKDKAEAEALERAMVQDDVKRGSRRIPRSRRGAKGLGAVGDISGDRSASFEDLGLRE